MSSLKYVDKHRIAKFFGFENGFIFTNLSQKGIPYNKTNTRDMILEACGIDIYSDKNYTFLSQEKCIKKIWDEGTDKMVSSLLEVMLDFYSSVYNWNWCYEDEVDYKYLIELQKELATKNSTKLPYKIKENLQMLQKDIETNFAKGTPELCLDRLHTYSVVFFSEMCETHGIDTTDPTGNPKPLHSIAGEIAKFYEKENLLGTDFAVKAFRSEINLLDKLNNIRNNKSFAHDNEILEKAEASFVVMSISNILQFVDVLEKEYQRINAPIDDDLPF